MNVRKLTHSFLAKLIAIILLIALSAVCLVGAGIYAYFAYAPGYDGICRYIDSPLFSAEAESRANQALRTYRYEGLVMAFPDSNFRYTITDEETGEVVATNIAPGETLAGVRHIHSASYYLPVEATPTPSAAPAASDALPPVTPTAPPPSDPAGALALPDITPTPTPTPTPDAAGVLPTPQSEQRMLSLRFEGTLLSPMTEDDVFFRQAAAFDWLHARTDAALAIAIVSFVLCIFLCVFLLCASGRHQDSAEPRPGWLDRVPGDLLLGVIAFLVFCVLYCAVWVGDASLYSGRNLLFLLLLLVPLYILGMLLLIGLMMGVATRIKTRTLFSNTVIAWVLRGCIRLCRGAVQGIRTFFASLPLTWQTVVFFLVFGLVNAVSLVCLLRSGSAFGTLLSLLIFLGFNAAVFALAIRVTLQMNELRRGGEAIAAGNTAHRVDTARMLPALQKHGEHLNAINTGVANAVEARMKSERMKTDLITNVSHDLKTPLTSIVNYIDLLKKEPLTETCQSYVEVLDRQAQRLTKLTSDVVEASKASSGATQVELAPTNAVEIMTQSLAEYQARLEAVPLSVVVRAPEAPIYVMADGRLLWRVFDNLLGNIVKYAMPATRVYLEAREDGCEAVVSLKNVSRDQLGLSAEELMERFVQGDASRAGGGSGLGLSIAKSLVELQNGTMDLRIDGDLFTARIAFPKAAGEA